MEIYQYKTLSKNTLVSLLNNEIWFSEPSRFNDPYDCFTEFVYKGTIEEWKKLFIENNNDIMQINRMLQELQDDKDLFEEKFRKGNRNSISSYLRVACFSKNYSNVLMWSHYADYHKGICIGYEVLKEKKTKFISINDAEIETLHYNGQQLLPVVEVDYHEEMKYIYNPLTQSVDDLINYVYKKSNIWRYEKELRSIIKKGIKDNVRIDNEVITTLFLGSKMEFSDILSIKNIIHQINEKRKKKIKLYKMEMCKNTMRLRPTKIN